VTLDWSGIAPPIRVGGKRISLGYFNTPEEAAHEYSKAARNYFGEFACP
jgi:hypothetical protein